MATVDRATMRDELAKQILAMLDAGEIPWRKPWIGKGGLPVNVLTSKHYSGMNALLLMWAGESYWAGYGQWKKVGGQVRKGEKALTVFRPVFRTFDKGTSEERTIPVNFASCKVFAASQQDGWEAPKIETSAEALTPNQKADAIIDTMQNRPTITHAATDRACYSPMLDKVMMPEREQFRMAEGYYSTIFHELSHSTGHESRNNREKFNDHSKHEYSKEELIAEFSAMFLNAECGIAPAVMENATAYIQTWQRRLQASPEMLDGVLTAAQKSADYILGLDSIARRNARAEAKSA